MPPPIASNPFSHSPLKVEGRINWDHAQIEGMLHGERSDTMRDMQRRAERVVSAARRQVRLGHVHAPNTGGGDAGWPPLRDTIHSRVERGPEGEYIAVGSDHPIALIHHEGTRPHLIVPRRPGGVLVFSRPSGGRVFTKRVHHPGTRPNRYLTDNMWLATRG